MFSRHSVRTPVVFMFLIPLMLFAAPVMSQSFYGSLLAVVGDAQGGVIPGATVILVNTSTN